MLARCRMGDAGLQHDAGNGSAVERSPARRARAARGSGRQHEGPSFWLDPAQRGAAPSRRRGSRVTLASARSARRRHRRRQRATAGRLRCERGRSTFDRSLACSCRVPLLHLWEARLDHVESRQGRSRSAGVQSRMIASRSGCSSYIGASGARSMPGWHRRQRRPQWASAPRHPRPPVTALNVPGRHVPRLCPLEKPSVRGAVRLEEPPATVSALTRCRWA